MRQIPKHLRIITHLLDGAKPQGCIYSSDRSPGLHCIERTGRSDCNVPTPYGTKPIYRRKDGKCMVPYDPDHYEPNTPDDREANDPVACPCCGRSVEANASCPAWCDSGECLGIHDPRPGSPSPSRWARWSQVLHPANVRHTWRTWRWKRQVRRYPDDLPF